MIYEFIISLASLIEELESHGFYCIYIDFNSIYLKEEHTFKFTYQDNILKMKQMNLPLCAEKHQKTEAELINCTDNIISYLLDMTNPLL